MSTSYRRGRLLWGCAAALACMSVFTPAVSASKVTSGTTEPSAGGDRYTPEEVAEASGERMVRPIFAVPRDIEEYSFAFINPSATFPFFAEWSAGMNAAAEFYGVELNEADLDFVYEDALSAFEQLAITEPDVLGGGGGNLNDATLAAAAAEGIPVVSIDGEVEGGTSFGVNDQQVGELSLELLIEPANARLENEWSGRNLVVAGISAPNCVPCDARINAAFELAKTEFDLTDDDTFMLVPGGGQDPNVAAQSTFTDFLTAHPDDVVLIVSYGDDAVVAALNALKESDRSGDALAVASGGSEPARAALRDPSNADMLVAAIDFQPFAEGWNWVEAAIAVSLGEEIDEFRVDRVLTADNVDEFYPNDAA